MLKDEIRADAHYLSLSRNERDDASDVYKWFFIPSVKASATNGFTASTNSRIDYKFHSAIEEARNGLTKYFSLKEWQSIADVKPPLKN